MKRTCWLAMVCAFTFQIIGCVSAAPWEFLRVVDKVEGKTQQLPNYKAVLNWCDHSSCPYVDLSCDTRVSLVVSPDSRSKIKPKFEIYFVNNNIKININPSMYVIDDVGALKLEGKKLSDLIPSCDSRRNSGYALHITVLPEKNYMEKIENGLTVNVDEPRPFHFSGTIYQITKAKEQNRAALLYF